MGVAENLSIEGEYQVVFTGLPVSGIDINRVRKNFNNKFKLPPERLSSIFNGGPVTLQSNLDWSRATKYSEAMKELGALCDITRGQKITAVDVGLSPCPKCNSLQIGETCNECGFGIQSYRMQMGKKGFVAGPDSGYIKNKRNAPRRLNVDRRDDVRFEEKRRLGTERRKNYSDWYSD